MKEKIRGIFEVKMTPQKEVGPVEDALHGRLFLDKEYFGDLEGHGLGQMLSVGSAVKGSAGYVAIEKVTGQLMGREGSFAIQHFGLMDRGKPFLRITVIPDSGTGELTGLSGEMNIEISEGQHFYHFEFELPDSSD